MSKVLQWLRLAIELRCEDVVARRDAVEFKRYEREKQIIAVSERQKNFETMMADRLAAYEALNEDDDEKKEPFDQNKFKAEFDAANPEIKIEEEVTSEIDNDFNLPYKPPAASEE